MHTLLTKEEYEMTEKLLTPNELSKILGVTQHTLAVWRCTGRYNIPYIKAGRLVRYNRDDIAAFIMRRHHESSDTSASAY